MGKALLLSTSINTQTNSTFSTVAGSNGIIAGTPETRVQFTARVAGVLSKLAVLADNVGTSRAVTNRRGGADVNMVVNPTDTTAGLYQDNTNTDTVTAGDVMFDVKVLSTGGAPTYYWKRLVFTATSDHACYYATAPQNSNLSTASSTNYFPICGTKGASNTTEANARMRMRAGGTFGNLQINVTVNTRPDATTVISRKNGGNGSCSISVGIGLTGVFEDTSNTDTIASGDDLCIAITLGGGVGNFSLLGAMGGTIVNTAGSVNDIFAALGTGATRAASATADYYFIAGHLISVGSTEANAKVQHGFAVATTYLRINLTANTYTVAGVVNLRKNGANANQNIVIPALLTGWFEDPDREDNFDATDDTCVSIVGGTTGSITIRAIGLTEADGSYTPGPLWRQNPMDGMGSGGPFFHDPMTV